MTKKQKKSSNDSRKLTLEESELKIRSESAQKTPFRIKILDEKNLPFTNYEIVGDSKIPYTVEIRSLKEKINSCSCPDWKVNNLGTCKHIEGVTHFIRKKGKRKFNEHAKNGSCNTEIFLNPQGPEVCIRWGQADDHHHAVRSLLDPYISANHTLLADPSIGIASIEHALKGASTEVASKIKISQHLMDWTAEQHLTQSREMDRKMFLEDVQAGKRSLQMLSANLLPYQEEGMLHLAFQGRAILADEMGLGKTIQAIAACELLRRLNRAEKVVVITPASLKGEWKEQIEKFTNLPTLIVSGSRGQRLASYKQESFFYLVNYEQVRTDFEEIQTLLNPDIMVLDEAQRAKNWQTKTAWAVKQIKTPYAFVLTGTPIENKIDDLYSIMQIVDSRILGPLYQFKRDFYVFDEKDKPIKYKNLDQLHHKVKSVVLRRRKKDVEEMLPERIVNNYLVKMCPEQLIRYDEYSLQVASLLSVLKKRPLTPEESKKLQRLLACMRMVADTPYILDEACKECPKLEELEEILSGLMQENDAKVIIFSEWERMLFLVKDLADKLQLDYAWHSGSVSQEKRREEIDRFKKDANCKLFLTTDSGSTGLNLQVANVVINLDLPWNPAKLEQRIARAWRKNQTRVVQVINLVTEDSIEQRMLSALAMKQAVADAVLDSLGNLSEMPLPSASRDDFIKNLEQLIGRNAAYEITKERPKIIHSEDLKREILAKHSDRIHLLKSNQNMILAVVDKKDQIIKESIENTAQSQVEILDFETFATLKRLNEAGIIKFNFNDEPILYQSSLLKEKQQKKIQESLEQANNLYAEAERKLKMALLLKSGGFLLEAIPAASEAFTKAVEIFKVIEQTPNTTTAWLKEQLPNIQEPEAFINTMESWMKDVSEAITKYALGVTEDLSSKPF